MAFANLGFETGVSGAPGDAANWTIEYGVSVEVYAAYPGPVYIEAVEGFEYWSNGWQLGLGSTDTATYAALLLDPPNGFEGFELGFDNDVWLLDLGATGSAQYGAALDAFEAFELEWNTAGWQLGIGSTTTAAYDTAPENFEDHEENWSNDAWQLALGATAAASFDGANAEAVEDFDEVVAPIPFTADPATGVLTAPAHGFADGVKMLVRTTGQLPGGLSPALEYWTVNTGPNDLQLARVIAGPPVSIDHQGGGTHTLIVDPSIFWNDTVPD